MVKHRGHTFVDVFPFRLSGNVVEFLILQVNPETLASNTEDPLWQAVHGEAGWGESAPKAALAMLDRQTGIKVEALYRLDDLHLQRISRVPSLRIGRCVSPGSKDDEFDLTVVFAAECVVNTEPILTREHSRFDWVPRDHAIKMLRLAARRAMFEKIEESVIKYNCSDLCRVKLQ